ncbi:Arm DNA-binding domain-containing protein, partial [Bacteroides uniformis]|uniref:Arm DNA-binding domain-containing protein n=1 Tax=Bacteroides uniformis TaxID=820 RepID=UPI00233ED617
MNACVSVVCYKSKTLSNGENPLMLQVSKGGKRKYQSLGISINPKYWDFTRNKPKPNCPNKEYIQKIILDKQRELQQRMLELNSEQKEYTTTTLLNNENTKFELKTVSMFYKWKIQCKLPPKTKRFCPLKTFNNAPLKSLDRWGYYYFSLFPSVCSHFTDTFSCQLNPVRR